MSEHIRSIQSGLAGLGYAPGPIDGQDGPRTRAAASLYGSSKKPASGPISAPVSIYPRQADMVAFYGSAGGPDCTAGSVSLPFAFPLAWDQSQRVTRFSCHKKLAAPITEIFAAAAEHYGEAAFRELRLDQFGGCYNFRAKRGGSSLSMHAWGAAVDLDPINNQLTWGRGRATFAQPEYAPFWEIVEAHGGVSLGRTQNRDWMHFQFARL